MRRCIRSSRSRRSTARWHPRGGRRSRPTSAWSRPSDEYLRKFDKGRGVVLIGHSQGAALLIQLIKEEDRPQRPELRKLLVSAILLGGNVLVPEGNRRRRFQNVPTARPRCRRLRDRLLDVPQRTAGGSFFGRPAARCSEAASTPPARKSVRQPGAAQPERRRRAAAPVRADDALPGALGASRRRRPPDAVGRLARRVTAQCQNENGASWLQVSPASSVTEADCTNAKRDHEVARGTARPRMGPAPVRRRPDGRQPRQHGRATERRLPGRTLGAATPGPHRAPCASHPSPRAARAGVRVSLFPGRGGGFRLTVGPRRRPAPTRAR